LEGLVPVAEYGSKFDADVAANLLIDAGIRATTSYDPALNSVATYFASDRTVDVVVLPADVDRARAVLRDAAVDLPDAFTSPEVLELQQASVRERERTRVSMRTVAVVVLLAAFVVPLLIGLVSVLRS